MYSGVIRLTGAGGGGAETVAVTLLVSQVPQTILTTPSGLLFVGVEGGTTPPQAFGIRNTGQGIMRWTAEASTISGGNWLIVSPGEGSSDAESRLVPLVDVRVNPSGLAAGRYSGLVRVGSSTANNSPQFLTVELQILPAGSDIGAVVQPSGLIFVAEAGTFSPGSQLIRVATAKSGEVEVRSGVLAEGGNWIETLPVNFLLSPADPRTIAVQPSIGSLGPGVHRGTITLQFGDGSPSREVPVVFIVTPAAAAGTVATPFGEYSWTSPAASRAAACIPQRLVALQRGLQANFSLAVSWPSALEVLVADDCGTPVNNAAVTASFSNGDSPQALASLRNGTYVGTWRPINAAAQMAVTVRGNLAPLQAVELQTVGRVAVNPRAPIVFSGGIVNAASFARGEAVAPGSIVSLFGLNLAGGLNFAAAVPLPTTLGGVSLTVSGQDVPLFFSSEGQINAQIPAELPANTRPQVVLRVRRDGADTLAVPETITVAAVRPAIFVTNQQGTGQGAILDGQGRLVDSSAAATAGNVVQIFCTGLGLTNPTVPSGQPAPGQEPLARVASPVVVTIGGRETTTEFAGLAPGFVGLYQVNARLPAGIAPGPTVPVVITQGGVPSNTVTIAVR